MVQNPLDVAIKKELVAQAPRFGKNHRFVGPRWLKPPLGLAEILFFFGPLPTSTLRPKKTRRGSGLKMGYDPPKLGSPLVSTYIKSNPARVRHGLQRFFIICQMSDSAVAPDKVHPQVNARVVF